MFLSLFTWQHGSLPGIQVGLNSMLAKLVNTHTHTLRLKPKLDPVLCFAVAAGQVVCLGS
jgi:hypothetical protein